MKLNLFVAAISIALFTVGCVSKPVDNRNPAGTGDIGSSTDQFSFESFKLPVTRENKVATRVAYNSWSGEWPSPVIDVRSEEPGVTQITGYTNLRNPVASDKTNCTIKNGLYHPWSQTDPSSITYYTIQGEADFKTVRDTTKTFYNEKTHKTEKIKIPKGTLFSNVVYYGENFCGSIQTVGKTKRPFSEGCDFFFDNKDMVRIADGGDFSEQWLYLKCEEKDSNGKNVKAFVKDTDLLSQPRISKGCPAEYGKVQSAKNCAQ
ncbi:MAG: hypothetical protein H7256_16625 [Bdellovibrio sp.]|nr:hypothetical protein [Bdellovibrio sp.]